MQLNYDNTYPSRRPLVMGRNIVATSQPLAAQVGIQMLQSGGNAADAAVATAAAMTVLEPCGNGLGSDAFCLIWDGNELHGLNASGRSPLAFEPRHIANAKGEVPRGWNSVTVPGAVSGWVELSSRFGTLPFQKLLEPAIHYATEGYRVGPITARAWASAEKTYSAPQYAEFQRTFLPGGRAPSAGDLFRFPDAARTLQSIAATKGESFYNGELAVAIAADAAKHGAPLAITDLADHRAEWVGTIHREYGGAELHEIPPNGQGLAALIALGILEQVCVSEHAVDSAESVHLQVEAMKLALADVYAFVSDAHHMRGVTVKMLLDNEYLRQRAKLIDPAKAGTPEHGKPNRGGTIYLTAADANGMMVSFIQSNYYGFGSGVVVPGTGISLQNRAAGFVQDPEHPNHAAGGKRPFHTIIPGFLMHSGAPLLSFGVMGGPMQAQGHVQMVLRLVDHKQNPQTLADAPRWRVLDGLELALEEGFPAATVAGLENRGHVIHRSKLGVDFGFGGAQLIHKQSDGSYTAGSDPRKDGMAIGY